MKSVRRCRCVYMNQVEKEWMLRIEPHCEIIFSSVSGTFHTPNLFQTHTKRNIDKKPLHSIEHYSRCTLCIHRRDKRSSFPQNEAGRLPLWWYHPCVNLSKKPLNAYLRISLFLSNMQLKRNYVTVNAA